MLQVWTRPWACLDPTLSHRLAMVDGVVRVPEMHKGALWLYADRRHTLQAQGAGSPFHAIGSFRLQGAESLLGHLPLPLRSQRPLTLVADGAPVQIDWHALPDRPLPQAEPVTDAEKRAHRLMLRARSVWARLHDVETALADPANLWSSLHARWTKPGTDDEPTMEIVVRHAEELSASLDLLERVPRQVLRRTHASVALSRASEIDRRAMIWLIRQPGESMAERAGDRQRVLAVVREESLDTLENRVLRAYCELAWHVAREYQERYAHLQKSRRVTLVDAFGRRCRRLAHTLAARGVRQAMPGIVPNFVLQHNPHYHAIWQGWCELIQRQKAIDDLWRWQSRSWEEFCAVAVAVAMVGLAEPVATAPLRFRTEQHDGSWIEHDNPLAVFVLARRRLVVELWHRMEILDRDRAPLAAPLWIKISRLGETSELPREIPLWPIWDAQGGLHVEEAQGLATLLRTYNRGRYARALVIRPLADGGSHEEGRDGDVLALTLGTDGEGLANGMAALVRFLVESLDGSDAR